MISAPWKGILPPSLIHTTIEGNPLTINFEKMLGARRGASDTAKFQFHKVSFLKDQTKLVSMA
jgi:hypothetical protein